VAEKAESNTGWLFPVGDEVGGLGYTEMFNDMFNCMDTKGTPREDFYDGYVVNAILDAAFKSALSKRWEPVLLEDWRGKTEVESQSFMTDYDTEHFLIKEEKMPDGRTKLILKEKAGGKVVQKVIEAG
jgi:hypothetical protein